MTRVTLTFDNGPTPGVTDNVLEILKRYRLRCTFFVIGQKLEDGASTALMQEAHAAGHWIGNHTLTHSVALGDRRDGAYAALEIGETQARIGSSSRPEKLFRPYGNEGLIGPHLLSRSAVDYLLAHRYTALIWNCLPGDWKDATGWVDRCLDQVAVQDWAVVVLHDIENSCLPRLSELVQRLAERSVIFEQSFPDSVILTRDGCTVNLRADYVADERAAAPASESR